MRIRTAALVATLLMLMFAPGARGAIPPSRITSTTDGPDHVVVMVFENREADTIMGRHSSAPYFRALARRSVMLKRLFAITHPSLPNYLALTSGSTHDVHTDCTSCLVDGPNVVDQLEQASVSWKAYMESMPGPCSTAVTAGKYAMKHNPFMYYTDIRDDADRCNSVVPMRQLTTDLQSGSLPTFAWVSPNLCHDMHDCSVATGDRFLRNWAPRIVAALGSDGILIVVFDEGVTASGCCHDQAAGGQIAGIIAGPGAAVGATIRAKVNLFSILKLIQDAWGLGDLDETADAPSIDGWRADGT
jgi:phospholipase C